MDADKKTIENVPGDGGSRPLTPEMWQMLQDELKAIETSARYTAWRQRQTSEDVRLCRWSGQAPDGKKHREYMDGEEPFPFEGASDGRVRTADSVVNFLVAVLVTAATKMQWQMVSMNSTDMLASQKMQTLLRWLMRSQLGKDLRAQLILTAQYMLGDSPGASILGVYWCEETAIGMETVKAADIAQAVGKAALASGSVRTHQDAQRAGQELQAIFNDPNREDDLMELLRQYVGDAVTKERLRDMVKQMRETGEAEFPMPYRRYAGPKLAAKRLYEDVWFSGDTVYDIQKCRMVLDGEWLFESELRARVADPYYNYSEAFVEEALKFKGKPAFSETNTDEMRQVEGDYSTGARNRNPEPHKDQVQILHAYWKATTDTGDAGVFTVTYHPQVKEQAANDVRLLDYEHGKYPFVFFAREILTKRIIDTRGLPETLMTHQAALKLLHDSIGDHVSLSTLPPVKVPRNRPDLSLVLGPLVKVKENRPGEIDYMKGPDYPRAAEAHREELRRQIAEYTGVPVSATVSPMFQQVLLQFAVDGFLENWREVLVQIMQLAQQYLTDEDIARVTGGSPMVLPRSRQDIQGQFDMTVAFDAAVLDQEQLIKKLEVVNKVILTMDSTATVNRSKLVTLAMTMLDANWAEAVCEPPEVASMNEILDEQQNFTKIATGIAPPMILQGQNHALRLQFYQQQQQQNPHSFQRLAPDAQQILASRIEFLQQQVDQQKNKAVGVFGTQPAPLSQ